MAAPKGHKPYAGGGRPKGSQNKITTDLKQAILGALEDVGGPRAYFARQALENPNAFMTLVGKILPTTIAAESDTGIQITLVKYPFENENGTTKQLAGKKVSARSLEVSS